MNLLTFIAAISLVSAELDDFLVYGNNGVARQLTPRHRPRHGHVYRRRHCDDEATFLGGQAIIKDDIDDEGIIFEFNDAEFAKRMPSAGTGHTHGRGSPNQDRKRDRTFHEGTVEPGEDLDGFAVGGPDGTPPGEHHHGRKRPFGPPHGPPPHGPPPHGRPRHDDDDDDYEGTVEPGEDLDGFAVGGPDGTPPGEHHHGRKRPFGPPRGPPPHGPPPHGRPGHDDDDDDYEGTVEPGEDLDGFAVGGPDEFFNNTEAPAVALSSEVPAVSASTEAPAVALA